MATPADAATNLLSMTPPVIRFYAGITLVTSLCAYVLQVFSPYAIIWHKSYMAQMPPHLWRLVTSFFLTGPNLSILFDTYMLWKYGSELESQHFGTSGDFLLYLVFNGAIILLLNSFLLGGMYFAPVMAISLAYSWGQRNRGQSMGFFFVQIKAQWLPFAIAAVAAIQAPAAAFILMSGIVSAHAYEFLTVLWPRFGGGTNLLQTPSWLKWSFEGGPGTRGGGTGGVRAYGTGFDPRSQGAPAPRQSQGMFGGTSTGRATGSSAGQSAASAWRNRGSGHRLGSD
ncbi:hypothetical protein DRE_06207 [Drechslerella stenobrocha 248]|uniref:Derlin n=1 Tax=Drechslerella stenobrocha 248 TaxID=1043628 RepID=W7HYQ5_9PEZI|nr:hypothetical protein DRE_06207 [Drechslerella stenobrocha 248]